MGFPENDSESPRDFYKCDHFCTKLPDWVVLETRGVEGPQFEKNVLEESHGPFGFLPSHIRSADVE